MVGQGQTSGTGDHGGHRYIAKGRSGLFQKFCESLLDLGKVTAVIGKQNNAILVQYGDFNGRRTNIDTDTNLWIHTSSSCVESNGPIFILSLKISFKNIQLILSYLTTSREVFQLTNMTDLSNGKKTKKNPPGRCRNDDDLPLRQVGVHKTVSMLPASPRGRSAFRRLPGLPFITCWVKNVSRVSNPVGFIRFLFGRCTPRASYCSSSGMTSASTTSISKMS